MRHADSKVKILILFPTSLCGVLTFGALSLLLLLLLPSSSSSSSSFSPILMPTPSHSSLTDHSLLSLIQTRTPPEKFFFGVSRPRRRRLPHSLPTSKEECTMVKRGTDKRSYPKNCDRRTESAKVVQNQSYTSLSQLKPLRNALSAQLSTPRDGHNKPLSLGPQVKPHHEGMRGSPTADPGLESGFNPNPKLGLQVLVNPNQPRLQKRKKKKNPHEIASWGLLRRK